MLICNRGMSCHGGLAGFWLSHLAISERETLLKLQVRLHNDIDGSPLARAICASTGPLLFHVFTLWCRVLHTHKHTHTLTHFYEEIRVQFLRLREVPPEFEGAQRRVFQAVVGRNACICVHCLTKDSVNVAQHCSVHGGCRWGSTGHSFFIRLFQVSCGLVCCLGSGRARDLQSTSEPFCAP